MAENTELARMHLRVFVDVLFEAGEAAEGHLKLVWGAYERMEEGVVRLRLPLVGERMEEGGLGTA
jgi:hypothetical protein